MRKWDALAMGQAGRSARKKSPVGGGLFSLVPLRRPIEEFQCNFSLTINRSAVCQPDADYFVGSGITEEVKVKKQAQKLEIRACLLVPLRRPITFTMPFEYRKSLWLIKHIFTGATANASPP